MSYKCKTIGNNFDRLKMKDKIAECDKNIVYRKYPPQKKKKKLNNYIPTNNLLTI